jgi:hypothetical protein
VRNIEEKRDRRERRGQIRREKYYIQMRRERMVNIKVLHTNKERVLHTNKEREDGKH